MSGIEINPAPIDPSAQVPVSRQVIAGTGLSGGGALTGDVTLTVAPSAIVLDTLGAPTDITTRDASTSAHGLLPKLSVAGPVLQVLGSANTTVGADQAVTAAAEVIIGDSASLTPLTVTFNVATSRTVYAVVTVPAILGVNGAFNNWWLGYSTDAGATKHYVGVDGMYSNGAYHTTTTIMAISATAGSNTVSIYFTGDHNTGLNFNAGRQSTGDPGAVVVIVG